VDRSALLMPLEVSEHTSAALARLVPKDLDAECIPLLGGGMGETTARPRERFDRIFYTANRLIAKVVLRAATERTSPPQRSSSAARARASSTKR